MKIFWIGSSMVNFKYLSWTLSWKPRPRRKWSRSWSSRWWALLCLRWGGWRWSKKEQTFQWTAPQLPPDQLSSQLKDFWLWSLPVSSQVAWSVHRERSILSNRLKLSRREGSRRWEVSPGDGMVVTFLQWDSSNNENFSRLQYFIWKADWTMARLLVNF